MSIEIYNLSRSQWEELIDQWVIGNNAERNRLLLKRRLLDGICFEPLAEEFNMSVRQAQKIVYKWQDVLIRKI